MEKKKKLFQSIRTKIILLYVVMTIINVTLLTIIISDNQVDIISKNTRFETKEILSGISRNLKEYAVGLTGKDTNSLTNAQLSDAEQISRIQKMVSSQLSNYTVTDELGKIIYQTDTNQKLPLKFVENIQKSITIGEFSGAEYYLEVNSKNNSIDFYYPLFQAGFQNKVLYANYDLTKVRNVYRDMLLSIMIMIGLVVILHLIVAVYLYRLIIGPILKLRESTDSISSGKYDTRIPAVRNDEIGELAQDFNNMAGEIESTIGQLEEKNTMITNELKVARKVQESMIPSDAEFQGEKALSIAGKYLAMEDLGGDIYDVIKINDNKYGILIADVSGHGVSASLVTAMAKASFNADALLYETSGEVCESVNKKIARYMGEMALHYLTAFFAFLDIKTGELVYSCCGHHPGILMRKGDQSIERLEKGGLFIGSVPEFTYESGQTFMNKGDRLVIFTDGIVETMNKNKEMYEPERLLKVTKEFYNKTVKEYVDYVIDDVERFCDNAPPRDDRAILCIDYNPLETQEDKGTPDDSGKEEGEFKRVQMSDIYRALYV